MLCCLVLQHDGTRGSSFGWKLAEAAKENPEIFTVSGVRPPRSMQRKAALVIGSATAFDHYGP